MPAQAHVEGGVARPEAGVAASANRPLVGGVIISVDLAARKQVEGVPAVVREDRSELEARDDRALPRAIKHAGDDRSEEHTSELQSRGHLVCRLLLEKKKKNNN